METKAAFNQSGTHKYVLYYPTGIKSVSGATDDCVFERLPFVSGMGDYFGYYHGTNMIIVCVPDNYTIEEFNANIAGSKFTYPLATPTEIQLTPHEISLLKDYAYVSTNGTNIALDYHNGELASLADVSQLGETVNELGEYVDRNSMGTFIDVKSYTESNPYKFVSDGYVYISSQGAISGTIEVFVMGSNGIIAARIRHQIHAAYEDENLFVKRGMYLYVTSCPSQCFVQFRPIV